MPELTVPQLDFAPLSRLGEVYKNAQKERMLSDLGQYLVSGNPDYHQAASLAAAAGQLPTALHLLKLDSDRAKLNSENAAAEAFNEWIRGGGGSSPSSPSIPAAGVTPPQSSLDRPEVMPSARVWGDKEAEAAGIYEPRQPAAAANPSNAPATFNDRFAAAGGDMPVGPRPVRVVSAPLVTKQSQLSPEAVSAPMPAPAAGVAPVSSSPGSDLSPKARRLLTFATNPNLPASQRAMVKTLLDKELAASETTAAQKDFLFAKRNGGFTGSFIDFLKTKSQNINIGGGSDKQIFDAMEESAKAARASATGLDAIRNARGAIERGGIFGAGADIRLGLQKLGGVLGLDQSQVENTETFRAAIAPQVAAMLKATVGSAQISDSDRKFAEAAAGGSIQLNEGSIRRLLTVMERAGNVALQQHQRRLDAVYPSNQNYSRERALLEVRRPQMGQGVQGVQGSVPSRVRQNGHTYERQQDGSYKAID